MFVSLLLKQFPVLPGIGWQADCWESTERGGRAHASGSPPDFQSGLGNWLRWDTIGVTPKRNKNTQLWTHRNMHSLTESGFWRCYMELKLSKNKKRYGRKLNWLWFLVKIKQLYQSQRTVEWFSVYLRLREEELEFDAKHNTWRFVCRVDFWPVKCWSCPNAHTINILPTMPPKTSHPSSCLELRVCLSKGWHICVSLL